jgi:hypothetical protein
MPRAKASPNPLDQVWLVVVPQQAFVEPQFHFGERVQWAGEDDQGVWQRQTGGIMGMTFTGSHGWEYHIQPDASPTDVHQPNVVTRLVHLKVHDLTRIAAATAVETYLQPASAWSPTTQAAQVLGISSEQLRKLRRKGLFKVGTHCRDTSIPGSGLPRWQWHSERCQQALATPPAKRPVRFKG